MKQTGTILLVLLMAGVATAAIQTDGQHGNEAQYSRGDVKSFTFTDELFQDNDAAMEDAEFRCGRGKGKAKGHRKGKAKGKAKGHCQDTDTDPDPDDDEDDDDDDDDRDEWIPPTS